MPKEPITGNDPGDEDDNIGQKAASDSVPPHKENPGPHTRALTGDPGDGLKRSRGWKGNVGPGGMGC